MTVTADTDPKILLQHHRNQLANAIAALIDPRPTTHNGRIAWQDSIWTELQAGITNPGSGGTRTVPDSRPPCWLDAIALETEISRTARRWVRRGNGPQHPTENRLRYLTNHRWRPQDVALIEHITRQLDTWTKRYNSLVEVRPKTLPNPCPHCNHSHAYRWQDGERIRTPALHVTTTECRCHNCHTTWTPSQYALLARVLGYHTPEGVTQ